MFSSPSIRPQNHENADVVARKPNLGNSVTRKAFQDRSANLKLTSNVDNGMTPFKSKINVFADIKVPEVKKEEKKYPDWLLDTITNKEIKDCYGDILSFSERLRNRHVPIPSDPKITDFKRLEFDEIDPMVLTLPKENQHDFLEVENIEVPTLQFSNFDF